MLTLTSSGIISVSMPIEGREFVRYFSGFPITSLDQEIICYHKKNITVKNRKDIGSGVEVFVCRDKKDIYPEHSQFFELCGLFGKLIIRDEKVHAVQVHIPLTGERMGLNEDYVTMIYNICKAGYIVAHTTLQSKEYPFVQWSITDPTLIRMILESNTWVENRGVNSIVLPIASEIRADRAKEMLIDRCEQNGHKTIMLDEYDVALIECDPS